jgi:chitinase
LNEFKNKNNCLGNSLAPYEWNDQSTEWSKGMYERTTDLKRLNPNLKVLLAVGGK